MSNSGSSTNGPLHAARSPFGDVETPTEKVDRLPGILAGSEQLLAQAVVNMVLRGGGLLIHGTRDGGAIGLHAFYGGNKPARYAASPEELQALLEALANWEPAQPLQMRPRGSTGRQAGR